MSIMFTPTSIEEINNAFRSVERINQRIVHAMSYLYDELCPNKVVPLLFVPDILTEYLGSLQLVFADGKTDPVHESVIRLLYEEDARMLPLKYSPRELQLWKERKHPLHKTYNLPPHLQRAHLACMNLYSIVNAASESFLFTSPNKTLLCQSCTTAGCGGTVHRNGKCCSCSFAGTLDQTNRLVMLCV